MNLLIISHTPHYWRDTQIVGWGPTVKEIDQLATLFDEIRHIAVLYEKDAPLSSLPYSAKNVIFIPVRSSGGYTFASKLDVLRAFVGYWKIIYQEINLLTDEDIVHVRCPANISLLAVITLVFIRRVSRRWIKYAGNWQPERNEPFTYLLQRWLLKYNLARSLVTINGSWQGQQGHILSFYNPSLFEKDIQAVTKNYLLPPYRLVFVGSVNEAKGAGRVVLAALHLLASGVKLRVDIIGDGELRAELELMVIESKQQNSFRFHGWMPHEKIIPFYEQAHFILLPSLSEGWPKVLSEAMAYGVVPLAGAVSSIPQILQECKTGKALDPLDSNIFAHAICSYIENPELWEIESRAAQQAAYRFTYETYLEHIITVFAEKWQIKL